jgi:hypothetical protein
MLDYTAHLEKPRNDAANARVSGTIRPKAKRELFDRLYRDRDQLADEKSRLA